MTAPLLRWLFAFAAAGLLTFPAPAQSPFQLPTANHALYQPGHELQFLAPTAPEKPWTSGSFGCVRSEGWQMHEGLDIRALQHDRHGEPTDPVLATADGTICYVSTRPGLSNYGQYIVIRHFIEGLEIYSLYAHLSAIAPGVAPGQPVRTGQLIATMGRTSNSSEAITKDRAHCHFELNVFENEHFETWFRRNLPGERNDHGIWNGQNLNGLDPMQILLAERQPHFSLLQFVRGQTELFRVQVRATSFPYLRRYAPLVLANPRTARSGIAGYEISLNYNGVAFALMPRSAAEMTGPDRYNLLSVNEPEYRAHPCRKLVVKHGRHWDLTDRGRRELDLLTE